MKITGILLPFDMCKWLVEDADIEDVHGAHPVVGLPFILQVQGACEGTARPKD